MKRILKKLRELQKKGQLSRVLTYKLLLRTGLGRLVSFTSRGVRLRLVASEMTYEAWKTPANYRSEDAEFLKKVLEPGGLVVDVGANIGMIAMQSAQLVGKSGRVIAIEPNPRIAAFCEKNLQLNGLENVTLLQTALGSEEGFVSFNCDPCDDRSRVVTEGGVKVPLTTLDRVMERVPNGKINLLKIDVEGFELSVLEGATKSLERTQWLYMEVEAENYSKYGKTTESVMAILDAHGFDSFYCDEYGKWQPIKQSIPRAINLIGKKRALVEQSR